jgi:SAM-dependent methyltransferase
MTTAYDELAPIYDLVTAGYDHGPWLTKIERHARALGLRGRAVLDVACGTGASFLPLLERGYHVTGCDIAPEMLANAARKAPTARLEAADMRALPDLGRFDLILCLDDGINHLLEPDDVTGTFAGMRRNLAAGGIAVWDVNTAAIYRSAEAAASIVSSGDPFVTREARVQGRFTPGGLVDVVTHAFASNADLNWQRTTATVRQRHWPDAEIRRAAHEAGLVILDTFGQTPGAILHAEPDEDRHAKLLYFAASART